MKIDLTEILKNPKDKLIAVDLDDTLCQGQFWGKEDPKPKQEMIDKVWDWYKKGAHIIIYTGRQPKYLPQTQSWLVKHEVPFHGIAMQVKIGADVYIDDRALNIEDI
jgi:hypothetical protein